MIAHTSLRIIASKACCLLFLFSIYFKLQDDFSGCWITHTYPEQSASFSSQAIFCLLLLADMPSGTCSILSGALTEVTNSICLWMTRDAALRYRCSVLAIYCAYISCNPRWNTLYSCAVLFQQLKRICFELFGDLSCSPREQQRALRTRCASQLAEKPVQKLTSLLTIRILLLCWPCPTHCL